MKCVDTPQGPPGQKLQMPTEPNRSMPLAGLTIAVVGAGRIGSELIRNLGLMGIGRIDVFEREPPPPDNWVWSHPLVVATPHIAAQASFDTVAQQCVDALRRARDGLPQPLAVDRQAGY